MLPVNAGRVGASDTRSAFTFLANECRKRCAKASAQRTGKDQQPKSALLSLAEGLAVGEVAKLDLGVRRGSA